jgi:hypothetical protein
VSEPVIDPNRPHPARIYDYGIGGKNHFAVDRAALGRRETQGRQKA